jgi:membrane carboxypeptidase/penicillin-binding protein
MTIGLAAIYFGFHIVSMGTRVAAIGRGLPPVESVEALFYRQGEPTLPATRFYDRNGQVILGALVHPDTVGRRWLSLDPEAENVLPQFIVEAVVAYHDPAYWEVGDRLATGLGQQVGALVFGERVLPTRYGIVGQVAERALRTKSLFAMDPVGQFIQISMLSDEIERTFSRALVMEWYLNSAYFGNLAYGVDAAALLYFDKHASELTLAESAMLAPIASTPDQNPTDAPEAAKLHQVEALLAMVQAGSITEEQSEEALQEELHLRPVQEVREGLRMGQPGSYISARLAEILGREHLGQGGYRVKTSLDAKLQAQAECTTIYFLQRASGQVSEETAWQAAGECEAIDLLPALRPGDIGQKQQLSGAEVIVMDAEAGQILALVYQGEPFASAVASGSSGTAEHESGNMLLPFVYLTAFSRGYSPASMVLDIPEADSLPTGADMGTIHGPVSMRAALSNSYPWAARNTLNLTGENHVLRTLREVGFERLTGEGTPTGAEIAGGTVKIELVDLAFAHSALANLGHMAGRRVSPESQGDQVQPLEPIIVLQVLDPSGEEIFTSSPTQRSVVSPQLAYLVTDVLADPEAGEARGVGSDGMRLDRPAGFYSSVHLQTPGNWAVGYTPSHVVGTWLGMDGRRDFSGVSRAMRAGALWGALMRYSAGRGGIEDWRMPEGMVELEVCVPSGLLPTNYCPEVRTELFIQGTEPTSKDNLYRPFLVNMETGNLATVFTPIELVEERVYMIPPADALEWAALAGIEQPPEQYDGYRDRGEGEREVEITSPSQFSYLRGWVRVRGDVRVDDLDYYRLQYGPGLNPTRWVQIGEDQRAPVIGGQLGLWDTAELDGLYTLQLVAVLNDGRVRMDAVPMTIDAQPPSIRLISPEPGGHFSLRGDREVVIQAEVTDMTGLSRVEFYVDGRRVEVREAEPYSVRWRPQQQGEYVIFVRALDVAGNMAESERLSILIGR